MLAIVTDTSAHVGDVSQLTGSAPTMRRAALTMPESLLSIHDQVEADTISGSSHGTRNSARGGAERGKCWWKKPARAVPMVNGKTSDPPVNAAVCQTAGQKPGSLITVR